nr:EndoU domain-containing protein [Bacillus subtilis]
MLLKGGKSAVSTGSKDLAKVGKVAGGTIKKSGQSVKQFVKSPVNRYTPVLEGILQDAENTINVKNTPLLKRIAEKEKSSVLFKSEKPNGGNHRDTGSFNVNIPDSSIKHSDIGDFTKNPKTGDISKMKGGGHGQSNIEFLEKNNIDYNINKVYENGVRLGNVPGHKVKAKRSGSNQSWFPESWKESDIAADRCKDC